MMCELLLIIRLGTVSSRCITLRCCWMDVHSSLSPLVVVLVLLPHLRVNVDDDFRSARGRNCTRCGAAATYPLSSCRRATKYKMNIHPLKYPPLVSFYTMYPQAKRDLRIIDCTRDDFFRAREVSHARDKRKTRHFYLKRFILFYILCEEVPE